MRTSSATTPTGLVVAVLTFAPWSAVLIAVMQSLKSVQVRAVTVFFQLARDATMETCRSMMVAVTAALLSVAGLASFRHVIGRRPAVKSVVMV